jgi:hypothetical protein
MTDRERIEECLAHIRAYASVISPEFLIAVKRSVYRRISEPARPTGHQKHAILKWQLGSTAKTTRR